MLKPKPLPELKVTLARVERGQKAVPAREPFVRTKLGGKPDWIQGEETPECPDCSEPMIFVAQVDSIDGNAEANHLPLNTGKTLFMFGDAGMIYVFYCYDC